MSACAADGCTCGVCVFPGSIEAVADMVASIQTNVNRALPMAEDVRQMRHQLDLLAARIECLTGDVQACTLAVEKMADTLRAHSEDESSHPWLRATSGNGGSPP